MEKQLRFPFKNLIKTISKIFILARVMTLVDIFITVKSLSPLIFFEKTIIKY